MQCGICIGVLVVLGLLTLFLMAFWYIIMIVGVILITAFVTIKMWKYMAEVNFPRNYAIAIEVATLVLVGISFVPVLWWFITFAYAPAFILWMTGKVRELQWEAAQMRGNAQGRDDRPSRMFRYPADRGYPAQPRYTAPPRVYKEPKQSRNENHVQDDTAVRLQLLGMIKASPDGLGVADASKLLHISRDRVKALIFELIGKGKIEGSFTSKDIFTPQQGFDDALASNDENFASWDEKAKKKEGKMDG